MFDWTLKFLREKSNLESIDSRQLESLRVFHEVATALTSNLTLEEILKTIMSQMENFFGPEQWSLLLLDEETRELRYKLSAGIDEAALSEIRIQPGEGIAGHVAATGSPLVLSSVDNDEEWERYAAENPDMNFQSIACLPINHGDRTLGVLQLYNSKLDHLPEPSISFLQVLCNYTSIALQNARHVELIHRLSITDDCTGLFNARYLYEMLEEEITQYAAAVSNRVVSIHPPHFSLLFLDLDHFKSINDTHGHLIGSRLLAEIGSVIKRTLGPGHAAFRYGGDEFVALLRDLDKPAANILAESLRNELITTKFLSAAGLSLTITGSFGLATFPQDGNTLADIVRSADTMMYTAKANGRNCIAVADSAHPASLSTMPGSRHS